MLECSSDKLKRTCVYPVAIKKDLKILNLEELSLNKLMKEEDLYSDSKVLG